MGSQKVCRTCAKKENSTLLTFLFGEEAHQLDLREKIKKYTPIKLNENDSLPKSICFECKKTIISWHLFWEQCSKIENHLKLLNIVSEEICIEGENSSILTEFEKQIEKTSQNSVVKTPVCLKEVVSVPTKTLKGFYCIAKWCNSNNTTRRMFRLPKDKRCYIWLTRAGRDDLKTYEMKKLHYKYLCEDHFTEDSFTNSKKTALNRNALPSLFSNKYSNTASSPAKGSQISIVTNAFGKRYRPLICKETVPSKHSAMSQPVSLLAVNSASNLIKSTTTLKQPVNNIQHVLVLNADQKDIYLKLDKKKQTSQESLLGNISLKNKSFDILAKDLESSKQTEGKTVAHDSMIEAVKIIDCNKVLQSSENNGSVVLDGNSLQTIGSEVLDKELIEEDDGAQCRSIDSLFVPTTKPVSDFIKISEGESMFYPTNSRFESMTDSLQTISSLSKNFNSGSTAVIDTIDSFKDTESDSLCSTQFFRESMYPCFACGEVFLMKSSLAQHCKTYHNEKFDDSSIEVIPCSELSKDTSVQK